MSLKNDRIPVTMCSITTFYFERRAIGRCFWGTIVGIARMCELFKMRSVFSAIQLYTWQLIPYTSTFSTEPVTISTISARATFLSYLCKHRRKRFSVLKFYCSISQIYVRVASVPEELGVLSTWLMFAICARKDNKT